jgi:hypothetical protein
MPKYSHGLLMPSIEWVTQRMADPGHVETLLRFQPHVR